ncbi:MAG: TonB-dependent receptor [Ignavibacteriae bacterium]|nr:TonB-dependent receptor [Ignavibacteriota bacterium]NOG99980.1 TonB-dependent receptor [Ignavibacteriota bacterium]
MKVKIIISLFFLILATILNGQTGSISGSITDANGSPLVGANILIEGTIIGTVSDKNGMFELSGLKSGTYILEASMVGYKKNISDPIIISGNNIILNITLTEKILQYDQVVISAGKHKQNLSELPVSTSVINSNRISKKNIVKIDEILRYTPGVNVALDQVSIRGSSGFSRGAGTRVLMTLDGLPLSTGDTGELVWEMIPVTDVERIEVIKGSSSALYGSAAIGGVVNIISKNITSKPITLVKSYFGVYDNPAHDEWKWNNSYRTFNGITASHSNTFGDFGISLSLTRTEDLSYKRNNDLKRYSGFLKSTYKINDFSKLSFIAAGYSHDRGNFNFWKNSRQALEPPDLDLGARVKSDRIISGLIYESIISKVFSYNVKLSLYNNYWKEILGSENSSRSELYRAEVQTNFSVSDNLLIIGGLESSISQVSSTIFGSPDANTFGLYAQAENKFTKKLTLTAGLRFDYSKINQLDAVNSFSPKLGANYKINEKTILRAFAGTGFRAPTLAETYTSTNASGLIIRPNLELDPENNYTLEAGIIHLFFDKINFDAAIFHSEYFDLVEPTLTSDGDSRFIQFRNVTRARIQGIDISTGFELESIGTSFKFSYSYLWARDIENKIALKYRPRNTIYAEAEYTLGSFNLGTDVRYLSKVEEVDRELIENDFVIDGDKRVDVFVIDLHAGFSFFNFNIPANLNLNIYNLLNYNYVEVIGNISPIRNISLNLELLF